MHKPNHTPIISALIPIALLLSALYIGGAEAPAGQPWWDSSWQYRKSIQIDNTSNAKTLTDYSAAITFNAAALVAAGKLKSDLSDLLFFDPDSSNILNYRIESVPAPGQPALPDVMNWKFPGNPLGIPMYGYPSIMHPEVLYFPQGRGGYKYWMFYEPHNGTEVIALIRSNDGITWTDTGVTNPIIPHGPAGAFDSWACADPDVVVVNGTWHLFYDGSNHRADRIGLATSTDGLHWKKFDRDGDGSADPVLSADVNFVAPDGHKYESADIFLSPTAYHDGTRFWLWLNSGEGARDGCVVRVMLFSCTDPTGRWTRENNAEPVLSPQGWEGDVIWHTDVTRHGNEFWMYYCASRSAGSIGFAKSTDKVTWTRSPRNPILTTVSGTWEGSKLYRSSCIEVGGEIWLYYSAYADDVQNGKIGLAKALPSAGTSNAVIQVKIPSIPAGARKTIHMYHGNPSATAARNGTDRRKTAKWLMGSGDSNGAPPIVSISGTDQRFQDCRKGCDGQ